MFEKHHGCLIRVGREPDRQIAVAATMSQDPLDHMRERIAKCRRLAQYVNDPRTTEALLEMAEQGEADLISLMAERAASSNQSDPA